MATANVLFVDNANLVRLLRVIDSLTGLPESNMTGTITVYDQNDAILSGCDSLPIVYTAVPTVPFYYAALPAGTQLAVGTRYKIVFYSAAFGVKITDYWEGAVRGKV